MLRPLYINTHPGSFGFVLRLAGGKLQPVPVAVSRVCLASSRLESRVIRSGCRSLKAEVS